MRFRTSWLVGAIASSLLLGLAASPAVGDSLLDESFTGASLNDPSGWVAGGLFPPYSACLTASADTSATPIPGCENPAIDAPGSGALQLTSLTGNDGFALHNEALPTSAGLDISFKEAQWGGSGADGLSLFLVDGSTDLTAPGAPGGNLGYSPSDQSQYQGVANGLIGVGIDAWGNFGTFGALRDGASNADCTAPPGEPGSAGTGQTTSERTPNRVVIRGPGNGIHGYCFLGESPELTPFSAATRAEATHTVRIVLDPDAAATRNVTVYFDGTQVVQIPAPAELVAASSFKFGFSASIGGANDNHEVWDLTINTAPPVTPSTPQTPPAAAEPAPAVVVTPVFTG